MSSDTDKRAVMRLFDEAINKRQFEVLDEIVASEFVLHSALLGEVHGGDAYIQSVRGLLATCPDFHATVEDLFATDENALVTRLTYRGTDSGGFAKGHAATGKPFEFGAIYIWRVNNGKLVELWQEADRLRLFQQLGLVATA